MKQAIRSSVLPTVWLLVHATAGAQAPGPDRGSVPIPQTEVFVEDARWVPASRGAVPTGAIAHGREANGRPEDICRARAGSGLHLGKISQGSPGCVVVSRGRPLTLWNYQVLTEVYAHVEELRGLQEPRESRQRGETVVDLVRRRLAETSPANKKR